MHISSSSRSARPFSFWINSPWCEVTTCYQLLFLSACIMGKCLWLPGTRDPRSSQKIRADFQLRELLNSSDCPGGKDWIFQPPSPLSESRRPIHHLTRYTSCSQGSRGGGGRRRGGRKGGTPGDKCVAWHVGPAMMDTFCDGIVSPEAWAGLAAVRRRRRESLSQTETPRQAT